jgi:hypothetical protein
MVVSKEFSRLYASVLKLKFMEEELKLSFKTNRRAILLLSLLVDRGLDSAEVKGLIPPEAFEELKALTANLLGKAEFSEEFLESIRESGSGKTV